VTSNFIKSAIWQGVIFAVIVQILLIAVNYQLVFNMLGYKKAEDFSYQDTYFVAYHGILENTPNLALLVWVSSIFLASVITFGISKKYNIYRN
jgi:hypothetical protein